MFNSTLQIKKEGALSLGLYALSGFLLGTYLFVLATLMFHFIRSFSQPHFFEFLNTLMSSTLLVVSSLFISLPLAFSLFYLWFQKDPIYVRLRIHGYITAMAETPILILGLFFLVVLPGPYLSLLLLILFMTLPRFYFILN